MECSLLVEGKLRRITLTFAINFAVAITAFSRAWYSKKSFLWTQSLLEKTQKADSGILYPIDLGVATSSNNRYSK